MCYWEPFIFNVRPLLVHDVLNCNFDLFFRMSVLSTHFLVNLGILLMV